MNSAAPAAAVCSLTQSVKVTHIFPKGALGRIFFLPLKIYRLGITVMVYWALKINCLSVF